MNPPLIVSQLSKAPPLAIIRQSGTNLTSQFAAISSSYTTSPVKSKTTPTPKPITMSQLTLKMSQLLGLNSGGTFIVISYFGPMSFLDD